MRRSLIPVLIAGLLAAAPLAAQEMRPQLSVTGEGRVAAAPDMAVISIGVRREARLADEALRQSSAAMAEVIARLTEAGIEDRDIQTEALSLGPLYERSSNSTPRAVGFAAENRLTVRVRDLDALGGLLDAVSRDGANTLGSIQFAISETGELQDEARRAAVADARAKAELYAEAAGVTLGPLIAFSEFGGSVPVPQFRRPATMAMEEAVPIAGGELEVTAGVSMVFAIGE